MTDKNIEILKKQGFFFIRKCGDKYIAQHGITVYYGLYIDEQGIVRQS